MEDLRKKTRPSWSEPPSARSGSGVNEGMERPEEYAFWSFHGRRGPFYRLAGLAVNVTCRRDTEDYGEKNSKIDLEIK